ncbi:hypothetical protein L323_12160 [Ruminiclostridium papyrosolvens C7]|uniref:Uncharacterized protein n=1 Tax=Ruminiclostridium papyrosolvens C7 TaxID=1330534 RepID=U4R0J6_9FIRM|nr:hypothetical protein L323_12160 [Ruminiclostridium papyrosolvens C7]
MVPREISLVPLFWGWEFFNVKNFLKKLKTIIFERTNINAKTRIE